LKFLISHPWEVTTSRYFIPLSIVVVGALVALGVLLYKLSKRQ
jgi:hypothetical protein